MPYKDPAKNAACKKAYSEKNKEKEAARLKEYAENNREKVRLAKQKWRKANQAHQNALLAKYRATKIKATPIWLTVKQHAEIKEFYIMAKELEKIFPWRQEVDFASRWDEVLKAVHRIEDKLDTLRDSK